MMAAATAQGLIVPRGRCGRFGRVQPRAVPLLFAPRSLKTGARLRSVVHVTASLAAAAPAPATDAVLPESKLPWMQCWWPVGFVCDLDAARPNACQLLGENLVLCVLCRAVPSKNVH